MFSDTPSTRIARPVATRANCRAATRFVANLAARATPLFAATILAATQTLTPTQAQAQTRDTTQQDTARNSTTRPHPIEGVLVRAIRSSDAAPIAQKTIDRRLGLGGKVLPVMTQAMQRAFLAGRGIEAKNFRHGFRRIAPQGLLLGGIGPRQPLRHRVNPCVLR